LAKRFLQTELMDDPSLDTALHKQALNGLRRINAVSQSWQALWKPIRELARSGNEEVTVLDVACGGGDTLLNMSRQASREALPIRFTGLDISDTAIQVAIDAAQDRNLDIAFHTGDASAIRGGPSYDVVCCSLFLHHLSATQALELLGQMKAVASQMILVQDLLRTTAGFYLALIAPRLLTRSRIVHVDGVRSVRAAFSLNEVRKLADAAELKQAEIRRLWPQRFLLSWTRNPEL
jgi:2-polyprenyl-3-methyl-5-hydroxy-6-metoxy-1,4-benzoquinol methylase